MKDALQSLLALKSQLSVDSVINVECKSPITISLEKYQIAVDFYSEHPNKELLSSYQESLKICKELSLSFEFAEKISAECRKLRSLRISKMEREERMACLVSKRISNLENIHFYKTKLSNLKTQRVEIIGKKPH
ncbi:hypothetical protein G3489_19445 [Shewanella baltica]|uniref:hypothetical protein n=1 Tax=Shewanella baltica TaxID=62322 RepID=UPI00217D8466|nr:hypothetical protein [Shewanella baltica]MCS6271852.1 hypothetical protein [Shewanella baltica]